MDVVLVGAAAGNFGAFAIKDHDDAFAGVVLPEAQELAESLAGLSLVVLVEGTEIRPGENHAVAVHEEEGHGRGRIFEVLTLNVERPTLNAELGKMAGWRVDREGTQKAQKVKGGEGWEVREVAAAVLDLVILFDFWVLWRATLFNLVTAGLPGMGWGYGGEFQ